MEAVCLGEEDADLKIPGLLGWSLRIGYQSVLEKLKGTNNTPRPRTGWKQGIRIYISADMFVHVFDNA